MLFDLANDICNDGEKEECAGVLFLNIIATVPANELTTQWRDGSEYLVSGEEIMCFQFSRIIVFATQLSGFAPIKWGRAIQDSSIKIGSTGAHDRREKENLRLVL